MEYRKKFFSKRINDLLFPILFCIPLFFSCATASNVEKSSQNFPSMNKKFNEDLFADGTKIVTSKDLFADRDTLLLTFAGDLMAHQPLWKNGEFARIYTEISPLLLESDFSFTNLETPVCDKRPYSSYPTFNVHHEYADEAINAGFNVFSLTNNHTNDQGLEGIKATREYFKATKEERPIYYAGLKEKANGPLTYQFIEKDGWSILFVAITEILNTTNHSNIIDYVPPYKKDRDNFVKEIEDLQRNNPADLFILSIHCSDPEYVFDIRSSQTQWYQRLLDAGADVVWVNHPHVAKDWELIPDENNVARKIIFHSMGNLISSHATRGNTGEGFMTQVRFEKTEDQGIKIIEINPVLLTTYVTPDKHYVIRKLDSDFIDELENEDPEKTQFFGERKNFMKKISGNVKWQ